MPYCWDGHDNGQRAVETGVGLRLDRTSWTPEELTSAIASLLGNQTMRERLAANATKMVAKSGTARATEAILHLLRL
jgi:UDP:flavonoid glycosyltransferase YjiC (YdhE family)